MIRKTAFLCFILLNIWYAASAQGREKINFDGKFHMGSASDPLKDFIYGLPEIFAKSGFSGNTAINPAFNDSWRSVNLPHDWVVELPFIDSPDDQVMAHGYKPVTSLFPETSIGWYRKKFFVNNKDTGKKISILFDGIHRNADIWLNGFFVGNNMSGYSGVTYDGETVKHNLSLKNMPRILFFCSKTIFLADLRKIKTT